MANADSSIIRRFAKPQSRISAEYLNNAETHILLFFHHGADNDRFMASPNELKSALNRNSHIEQIAVEISETGQFALRKSVTIRE